MQEVEGTLGFPAVFVAGDRRMIADAGGQVRSGAAMKESFGEFVPIWIGNASIGSACELLRSGFAEKGDFIQKLPGWIAAATPSMALEMIECGLAAAGDFGERLKTWLRYPQYSYIRDYAMEHCGDDDISDEQVERWIAYANQDSAMQLIEDGVADREDFLSRSPDFFAYGMKPGTVKMLSVPDLVPQMFCEPEEMSIRILRTKDRLTPSAADELVRLEVISPGDVADMADLWKATVTPETLPAAVRLGIMSKEAAWDLCRLWGDGRALLDPQLVKYATQKAYGSIKMGDTVIACVAGTSEHAAFVSFGGITTSMRKDSIAWKSESNVSELLKAGQLLKCTVKRIEHINRPGRPRFVLDAKDASENPWPGIAKRFPVGEKVRGRISHVENYGIFVELEPGLRGLVHRSEIRWDAGRVNPIGLYHVGDDIEVVILNVNVAEEVIALSIKRLQKNPLEALMERFPVGAHVRGKVSEIMPFGVHVELEPGVVGILHHREMDWDCRTDKKSERIARYAVGDEIEAVVISYDMNERKFHLSVKRLTPDPWDTAVERFPDGKRVRGEIVEKNKFGLFVELAHGVVGLVHVSQLKQKGRSAKQHAVGDKIDVIVQSTDPVQRRICLGLKKPKAVARRLRPVQNDEDDDLGEKSCPP